MSQPLAHTTCHLSKMHETNLEIIGLGTTARCHKKVKKKNKERKKKVDPRWKSTGKEIKKGGGGGCRLSCAICFFGFFKTVSCGKMHALESFPLSLPRQCNQHGRDDLPQVVLSIDPQKCFLFLLQNTRHKAIPLADRMPPTYTRAILTFLLLVCAHLHESPKKEDSLHTHTHNTYTNIKFSLFLVHNGPR